MKCYFTLLFVIFTDYSRSIILCILYGIGLYLNFHLPMLSGEHTYIINITFLFYIFNKFTEEGLLFKLNVVYVGLLYQISFIRHMMDYDWVNGVGLYKFLNNPIYSSQPVEMGFHIVILNYLVLFSEISYLGLLFTRFNRIAILVNLLVNICCIYYLNNFVYYLFIFSFNVLLYTEEDL